MREWYERWLASTKWFQRVTQVPNPDHMMDLHAYRLTEYTVSFEYGKSGVGQVTSVRQRVV